MDKKKNLQNNFERELLDLQQKVKITQDRINKTRIKISETIDEAHLAKIRKNLSQIKE
jgi:hypothetical protein